MLDSNRAEDPDAAEDENPDPTKDGDPDLMEDKDLDPTKDVDQRKKSNL